MTDERERRLGEVNVEWHKQVDEFRASVRAETLREVGNLAEQAYFEGYEDAERGDPEERSPHRIKRGWKASRAFAIADALAHPEGTK